MAIYEKSVRLAGDWVKGKDVRSGTKCKLTSEVQRVPSQFQNKDGSIKNQDVGKIRFQGDQAEKNISVNRVSLEALISAYGSDSKGWVGKLLTAETMKVQVAGKMQTALYLVPDGFTLGEDSNGYMTISKDGVGDESVDVSDEEDVVDSIPF